MLRQYDGGTAEDIQRRHGCDSLTAMHVIQARAEFVEMSQRHADEIAALTRHLEVAQRIGLRVMLARRKGRKTVRIADVVTEAEAAS